MKNALILHGTDATSKDHWFVWLGKELEKLGYEVWIPDLPGADRPNVKKYNDFILSNKEFLFNKETIIVGHSSGAVEIFGLLQELRDKVKAVYLIGSFMNDLGWKSLSSLFVEPFDFDLIKTKSDKFVFFHSDDDPYCPLDHAKFLSEKTGGELIVLPGQKHFSTGTAGEKYKKFPELLEMIKEC